MSSRDAVIERRRKQLKEAVDDYTAQRYISHSFRAYVKENQLGDLVPEPQVGRERDAPRSDAFPDLLFISATGKIVIDIKALHSDSQQTFEDRLNEIRISYGGTLRYNGETFEAELVGCCPRHQAASLEPPAGVGVIGYDIEDATITFAPVRHDSNNREFRELFRGGALQFPLRYGTEKFLREEPPLAYTVRTVYDALWAASEEDLQTPDIRKADTEGLQPHLKSAYPAYLKSSAGDPIPQIAESRLRSALNFLQYHGWVRVEGNLIYIFTNRGERSGLLIDTFIRLQSADEYDELGAEGVSAGTALGERATLERYISPPDDQPPS